jgi:cleavage and polyadenylation specificity factor subunit 1
MPEGNGHNVFKFSTGAPSRWQAIPINCFYAVCPRGQIQRNLELEGCRSAFIDERTFIQVLVLRDGTVYPVEVTIDGKTVSRLSMMPALVQTTIPSLLKKINNDYVLIGSTVSS